MKVCVSGSFNRHMDELEEAVFQLTEAQHEVLAPRSLGIVDCDGAFLFVVGNKVRKVEYVVDEVFRAIGDFSLLVVVAPKGSVGMSVAMEIGFAIALGIPVVSTDVVDNWTLREYIQVVKDITSV